ncbi:hypothetical protein B484DRAFT_437097, partial [Ochromonadaceae sp. CCMP2298]
FAVQLHHATGHNSPDSNFSHPCQDTIDFLTDLYHSPTYGHTADTLMGPEWDLSDSPFEPSSTEDSSTGLHSSDEHHCPRRMDTSGSDDDLCFRSYMANSRSDDEEDDNIHDRDTPIRPSTPPPPDPDLSIYSENSDEGTRYIVDEWTGLTVSTLPQTSATNVSKLRSARRLHIARQTLTAEARQQFYSEPERTRRKDQRRRYRQTLARSRPSAHTSAKEQALALHATATLIEQSAAPPLSRSHSNASLASTHEFDVKQQRMIVPTDPPVERKESVEEQESRLHATARSARRHAESLESAGSRVSIADYGVYTRCKQDRLVSQNMWILDQLRPDDDTEAATFRRRLQALHRECAHYLRSAHRRAEVARQEQLAPSVQPPPFANTNMPRRQLYQLTLPYLQSERVRLQTWLEQTVGSRDSLTISLTSSFYSLSTENVYASSMHYTVTTSPCPTLRICFPRGIGRDQVNSPPAAPSLPPAQVDINRRAPFTPAWRQHLQNQANARAHQQSLQQQETGRRQSLLASAHQVQVFRQTASGQASIRQQQVQRDRLSDQAPTATSALQDPVGPQPQSEEDESSEDEEDKNVNNFKSFMISASAASHIHERDNDAVICVDSGSGVHLDRKLRPDTVDSAVPNYDKRLTIKGIDGRSLKVTHHGYIPGRGLFVVCPQAAADLLSVTELDREGHEVKFKDGTVHITDSKGTQIMGYRAKDHLLYVMRTDIQTLRTTRPKRAIRGRHNKHWNVTGSDDIEDN